MSTAVFYSLSTVCQYLTFYILSTVCQYLTLYNLSNVCQYVTLYILSTLSQYITLHHMLTATTLLVTLLQYHPLLLHIHCFDKRDFNFCNFRAKKGGVLSLAVQFLVSFKFFF